MQKLLIEDDEGKSVVVPLIRDEITIGRQEGNTIRLSEQNVSRRHARLVRRQDVLLLEDLSSYNGTKLNGTPLSAAAALKDGDIFLIGDYRMAIKEDRPSAVTANAAGATGPAMGQRAEVQDILDAQPTLPLQSFADLTAPPLAPARFIIVGRFMEGREFILDRPSLVIGRTAENDIVIEHKSISRHHARILREGNQYFAVDLESANGVRVNGVGHERVLLRPGDEVELGQVVLRFVTEEGGGEFERGFGRPGKRKAYAVAAACVAMLFLALVVVLSGGRSRRGRPATPPPPPVAVNPAPVPQPPPPPPAEPLADLLGAAKSAQETENWAEAVAAAGKAVAAYPDSTEAAGLRRLAEEEKGNAERFAALKEAADRSDYEAVVRGTSEIPENSVYRERASVLERSARTDYLNLHGEAAASKARTGDCDEAKQEAELVLAVDSTNKQARWIVGRCAALAKRSAQRLELKKETPAAPEPVVQPKTETQRKPVAQPKTETQRKPVAVATQPKSHMAPSATQAEAGVDPDKLIQQAREGWLRGQYAVAIDSARRALRAKPGLSSAYQIIAICSCSLHDSDTALRAYEKLDERNKQLVRSACQKSGISF